MANERSVNAQVRTDVPPLLAAALVALAALVFVPVVQRVPTWPTDLPPLVYSPEAALDAFVRAPRGRLPAGAERVLTTWEALSAATAASGSASSRAEAVSQAQSRFVDALDASAHDLASRAALRAEARRRFERSLATPGAPLTALASRHALAGSAAPAHATPAARLAWFDLRWERLSLRTPEQGALEPISATLSRLPRDTQRAVVAWGLAARCHELLGVGEFPLPGAPQRCASLRTELIGAAHALDRGYPAEEALIVNDALLAASLGLLARRATDLDVRASAHGARLEALGRAHDRLVPLVRARPTRRLERYLMAVVQALQE